MGFYWETTSGLKSGRRRVSKYRRGGRYGRPDVFITTVFSMKKKCKIKEGSLENEKSQPSSKYCSNFLVLFLFFDKTSQFISWWIYWNFLTFVELILNIFYSAFDTTISINKKNKHFHFPLLSEGFTTIDWGKSYLVCSSSIF